MQVLVSDQDQDWSNKMVKFLSEKSFDVVICNNGKDCQLNIYKKNFDVLVLDIDTQNHSGLEVLRYMRLNHPRIKVILTFKDKQRFAGLGISLEDLRKLGACDILVRPCSLEAMLKSIEGENQFEDWKKLTDTGQVQEAQEVSAIDEEFTRIKIETFHSGNTTIFDHYIRIGSNKYVKILHKGDFFDSARLSEFTKDKKMEFLYFKTKDRSTYINFINQVLEKMISTNNGSTELKLKITKNVTEKYVEEIYTQGLKPQLIEEGKAICENMYKLIQREKGLEDVLKMYKDYDPPAYAHLFLVSFLSIVISKNLDWTSARTVEMTAMASLLHDIGKLKLPPALRELRPTEMNGEQLRLYHQHPLLGVEMLQKYPLITEPIKQIVYQHHEYINGGGFPNGLNGSKIYPLAKIVSVANEFSNLLIQKKITPIHGLREFIADREMITKFDPLIVKSLVAGFLRKSK